LKYGNEFQVDKNKKLSKNYAWVSAKFRIALNPIENRFPIENELRTI